MRGGTLSRKNVYFPNLQMTPLPTRAELIVAVRQDVAILEHPDLWIHYFDLGIIKAAICAEPRVLCSPFLQSIWSNNSEIVLMAVRNNGPMLEFASPRLRASREVVMAAVANDTSSLEFASRALQHELSTHATTKRTFHDAFTRARIP